MFLQVKCVLALWALVVGHQTSAFQCANVSSIYSEESKELPTVLNKHEAALLLLLGYGGVAIILALVYISIRRYVFEEVNNVDSNFDAGGDVSASLTAVTLAAQLMWPADLLQSVTVAVKYGIAGVFWYCGSVMIVISLFPLFSYKFKAKAPGAKTYLQVIFVRCGRVAHTIFCMFALLVNIIVVAAILVSAMAILQTLVAGASPELCVLLVATLCGSYTFIGGLGSTFYVSYFNAGTTFIILCVMVVSIIYVKDPSYGTLDEIFQKVNCLPPVAGNRDGSYFTFLSEGSTLWAVQGVFVVSSMAYCDQASWQSRIAAKPLQGAIGFLLATLMWFAVPATIGTVLGITYLAQSAVDPSIRLSEDQINSGIVSAYMAELTLGKSGGLMMLTMFTMLTMSTGSGEIMGVSSIIVYDIYQTYINPFRLTLPAGSCTFCGQHDVRSERVQRGHSNGSLHASDLCKCPSPLTCEQCHSDMQRRKDPSKFLGRVFQYKCTYHGEFRTYQENLLNVKNWSILWVTVGFIPFGLALHSIGVDLNWIMVTGVIVTVPSFPGILLCVLWSKLTRIGLIVGCVSGLVIGIIADLLVAFLYFHGKGGFFLSTSEMYAVVAGSASGLLTSTVLTVLVSWWTHGIRSKEDEEEEWQKLRDIDNPLHPWALQFAEDFPEVKDGSTRPSMAQMEPVSNRGRVVSLVGGLVIVVIFLIIIPGTLAGLEVLTSLQFQAWTGSLNLWCLLMTLVSVVLVPIEEVRAVLLQLRAKVRSRDLPNNIPLRDAANQSNGLNGDLEHNHTLDNGQEASEHRLSNISKEAVNGTQQLQPKLKQRQSHQSTV